MVNVSWNPNALGLESSFLGSGLTGDDETFSLLFSVPADATPGVYIVRTDVSPKCPEDMACAAVIEGLEAQFTVTQASTLAETPAAPAKVASSLPSTGLDISKVLFTTVLLTIAAGLTALKLRKG